MLSWTKSNYKIHKRKPEKVFNILDNFLQINRDNKIEEILK